MRGNHRHNQPTGGGRGQTPPQQSLNLDLLLQQNPNAFLSNPGLQLLQCLTNVQQVPGFPVQNSNLLLQNSNFLHPSLNLPVQYPNFHVQDPNLFQIQGLNVPVQNSIQNSPRPPRPLSDGVATSQRDLQNPNMLLERIDRSAVKARRDLIAARESVSSWKVSQAVVSELQVDSWSSLGFQMQEVPSLQRLMVIEGKIHSFIHCFVGVRRITSLYDLQVAICKNEVVEKFEDLELGPLPRHPLVLHYFTSVQDAIEVHKITSVEIVSHLCEYLDSFPDQDVKIADFLDFMVQKRSVSSKEKLGVRIQSLGMHISAIREAKRLEDAPLKKYVESLKQKADRQIKKRPLLSSQKQQLDERFSAISQRIKSFYSAGEDFGGKHTRFPSSSSESEDSDEDRTSNVKVKGRLKHSTSLGENNTQHSCQRGERPSSCPYPSATEEITRLGLKVGTSSSSSYNESDCKSGKKLETEKARSGRPSVRVHKKREDSSVNASGGSISLPTKMPRRENKRKFAQAGSARTPGPKVIKREETEMDVPPSDNALEDKDDLSLCEDDLLLDDDSLRIFITTWRSAFQEKNAQEVLMSMLDSYSTKPRQKRMMMSMFAMYPLLGLLNLAVTSIKRGMWDNIYDTLQAINHSDVENMITDVKTKYEIIDVQPNQRSSEKIADTVDGVAVEEVISKIAVFPWHNVELQHDGMRLEPEKHPIFKKLYECEVWLVDQFSVKDFKSLGFGEFSLFIDRHYFSLPYEFQKLLTGGIGETTSLDVCILQDQLLTLVSQASHGLWSKETVSKEMISKLLRKQFPLLDFSFVGKGSLKDFMEAVWGYGNNVVSKCLLYSATLLGFSSDEDLLAWNESEFLAPKSVRTSTSGLSFPVTCKDAADLLIKAPMLSDLLSWSHWDQIYAPSLGTLVNFVLNEVNSKDLLCLVTKDGRVIRVDHEATVDSFLRAALKGDSFETAVQLLSVLSVFGGEKHTPTSLLKCHARRAFENIFSNSRDGSDVDAAFSNRDQIRCNLNHEFLAKKQNPDKAVSSAAIFFLDCLGYIPSEVRTFAAMVLLTGLRSVVKDASLAVLYECSQVEQRIMLHQMGLSLGIVEWIDDYHAFISVVRTVPDIYNTPSSMTIRKKLQTNSDILEDGHGESSSLTTEPLQGGSGQSKLGRVDRKTCASSGSISDDVSKGGSQHISQVYNNADAALIIESIRRDEFGLDPSLSITESCLLKKQHARLGRALHCLSHELYSQDSHFLLELVQNADDNVYPEKVEPTLILILEGSGITVLNNEVGFAAENIRALCDVGNSTKKGSNSGYIGQKGIGFKSVFRVTDAPEIHSKGFHVKFDISEGQIGFVLPTLIPACNIDVYCKLASADNDDPMEDSQWNTCIVLPFRSKLSEGNSMRSIITKFSDLHPSLLLFLHRLKCIKFMNMLDDSLTTMRREVLEDGIVKVSHGKDIMTWLVISEKLRADSIRRDVQLTEIAVAFTLQEVDCGYYVPILQQQPAFAFLPLRTYGLKFIVQGDFVLPSSREEVDEDSPWNQWLLSQIPDAFVRALESFCALPCFKENRGKAVSAFMSFVPLIGEVHGFFSSLPRMIISRLRMSDCLLLEGKRGQVPPCKALRGWDDQARTLLPDALLEEHLDLGLLQKDIFLSDQLAKALGVEEYGTKILIRVMLSLCHKDGAVQSMGLGWLSHWLNVLSTMSFQSSALTPDGFKLETDLMKSLEKLPFIPLSNGSYSSLIEGTIWLQMDALKSGTNVEYELKAFPNIYSKIRIVNPSLFSHQSPDHPYLDEYSIGNMIKLLQKIGVHQLSAHEVIKLHILPALSSEDPTNNRLLMTEYICFVMVHLQSNCAACQVDRDCIISELQKKAFILTNDGFKRVGEVPIHFSEDYGNPVNVNKLVDVMDMRWHMIDNMYIEHPANALFSCGLAKWRGFFQELGIGDFVQVVQVEKRITNVSGKMLGELPLDMNVHGPGSSGKDWESSELVQMLSELSNNGNLVGCKYLLMFLDEFWDNLFLDKVKGYWYSSSSGEAISFKSSFLRSICEFKWVASCLDGETHYPKELFHDCEEVRSILGASAPYVVPKVSSANLVTDIGFKTKVTLDDVLQILEVWVRSESSFKASLAQMSRLYEFISNELKTSRRCLVDEFKTQRFIFIPYASKPGPEDIVPGRFYSPEEVYWKDSTGSLDQINEVIFMPDQTDKTEQLRVKTLDNIYLRLHQFFVKDCGVLEAPPFDCYIKILLHLSSTAVPSEVANVVFQIFLKWNDQLKIGSISAEDIKYLKDSLSKEEIRLLPTVHDRWVSLHPSFGLVCWCDNKKLKKDFNNLDGIDFLYFGKFNGDDSDMTLMRIAHLLKTLGVPAISEVVTRDAIHDSPSDKSGSKAALINWALPYAQRYIYSVHPEKYLLFKQSRLDDLKHLQVLVVQKLVYRNVIRSFQKASRKRYKCSCLLQDNVFYVDLNSDNHGIFLELSRLFFNGDSELHLANFLHMITTMAESGSSKEQVESFVLNTQKFKNLSAAETPWTLETVRPSSHGSGDLPRSTPPTTVLLDEEGSSSKAKKRKSADWPPADWKTAPCFEFASVNGVLTTKVVSGAEDDSELVLSGLADATKLSVDHISLDEFEDVNENPCSVNPRNDHDVGSVHGSGSTKFHNRQQLHFRTPDQTQAKQTGRTGELLAFKYFTEEMGEQRVVNWVNEMSETGLPYDIIIGDNEYNREYIEVKATTNPRKDWFKITTREWQFASEMGDSYSVAHVVLKGDNSGAAASVSVYKNPVKQCQIGKLQLVILMPRGG